MYGPEKKVRICWGFCLLPWRLPCSWRRQRLQNLLLGVMVNLLTNPAAVLLHQLFPGWGVTLVLEGAVVVIEGAYYAKYGLRIRHPWLLSLSANALSFGVGVVINRLL